MVDQICRRGGGNFLTLELSPIVRSANGERFTA